jgi:hypothetical protein
MNSELEPHRNPSHERMLESLPDLSMIRMSDPKRVSTLTESSLEHIGKDINIMENKHHEIKELPTFVKDTLRSSYVKKDHISGGNPYLTYKKRA